MRAWTKASGFDRARVLFAALILIVGFAHEMWPNNVRLDTSTLVLIGLLLIVLVLPLLEELTLPGNVSARFRRDVADVEQAARALPRADSELATVSSRTPVAESARWVAPGLPEYLDALAAIAPTAASAAVRAELEHRLRAVYELTVGESAPESTAEVVRRLLAEGFIDPRQAELVYRVLELASTGAHAPNAEPADAALLVNAARRVSGSLSDSTEGRVQHFMSDISAQLRTARRVRGFSEAGGPGAPDFIVSTDSGRLIVEAKLIAEGTREVMRRLREARSQLDRIQPGLKAEEAVIVVPDHTSIPDRAREGSVPVLRVSELAGWIDEHE
jgi:hypothetical protein